MIEATYSAEAFQKNGLLVANTCSLVKLSVNVALNKRVCLLAGRNSKIVSRSSSNDGSSNLSASSNTCKNGIDKPRK